MKSRISGNIWYVIGFVIFTVLLLGGWYFKSVNEANTFNKYRSEDVPAATVWDAMFSELRVEANLR